MRIPIHRLLFKPTLSWRWGKLDGPRRGAYGVCDKKARVIEIDPRSPHPARVLLHELIHLAHPSWSEKHVWREEARRWKRMGWRDKARLYQALGKGLL